MEVAQELSLTDVCDRVVVEEKFGVTRKNFGPLPLRRAGTVRNKLAVS
jgi:hypothetical protein